MGMSERIRMALVITELEVGGAERCLVNLAAGLDHDRFEPVVYSLAARPPNDRQGLAGQLGEAGVPSRFVGVHSSRQFFAAVRRLRKWLVEQQPHVVQSFLFHANVVGTLAARLPVRPRIVQGMRVADPSRCRQLVERRLVAGVDRVVCVSRSVAAFYRERLRFPADKLVVIPNGVDIDRPAATAAADLAPLGIPADRRAILYVGRLHHQKGLDWLLGLAPELFRRLPNHDLLLVGAGPQRQRLQSLAESLGVACRVHWAGWRSDVPAILRSCSLLVLPSRWEGMPNVVLEAMAAGRPVVCTRAHGVEEMLGPAAEQQTAAQGDAEGFVAQVVRLASEPGLAEELGRRNRRRVAERFSVGAMIAAYEQLYVSLVS
jgi:starch synthase (maltosyl-transferring)